MAGTDLTDTIGSALGRIARDATETVSGNGSGGALSRNGGGALSGMRGVIAGAAVATAAPLAAKGAGRVMKGAVTKRLEGAMPDVADGVKSSVGKAVEQAGGVPDAAKEVGKKMVPGGGSGGSKGATGVGKGRRMPVQQAVDVAVPVKVAYNQWTQFEEWPQFMHRLDQATQEDDCTVSFKTKVWGISKEFVAEIAEQQPDERIKWQVTQGVTHTGVVTFHELAPRLTRVQVSLDVEPGSLIEKAGRGMRHVKRAVRADLARFKAFIEMEGEESGAWRGQIRDGKLVKKSSRSSSRGSARKRSRSGQHSGGSSGRSGSRSRASSSRKRGSRG
jgi:uncharacterized membrane protein